MSEEVVEQPVLSQEEKMQHVKTNILNTLNTFHNNQFNFINGLPIAEENKRFALMNLVQAVRWAQDAISVLKFEVVDKPEGTDDAAKEGDKQESHPEQHQEGNQGGEEAVTSSSDCLPESGQEQKQEEVSQPQPEGV